MAVKKIAISVPQDVLKRVDSLAKRTKKTRSGLITQILQHVANADGENEVIERINDLFADGEIVGEQKQTSEYFLHSPSRPYGKTKW